MSIRARMHGGHALFAVLWAILLTQPSQAKDCRDWDPSKEAGGAGLCVCKLEPDSGPCPGPQCRASYDPQASLANVMAALKQTPQLSGLGLKDFQEARASVAASVPGDMREISEGPPPEQLSACARYATGLVSEGDKLVTRLRKAEQYAEGNSPVVEGIVIAGRQKKGFAFLDAASGKEGFTPGLVMSMPGGSKPPGETPTAKAINVFSAMLQTWNLIFIDGTEFLSSQQLLGSQFSGQKIVYNGPQVKGLYEGHQPDLGATYVNSSGQTIVPSYAFDPRWGQGCGGEGIDVGVANVKNSEHQLLRAPDGSFGNEIANEDSWSNRHCPKGAKIANRAYARIPLYRGRIVNEVIRLHKSVIASVEKGVIPDTTDFDAPPACSRLRTELEALAGVIKTELDDIQRGLASEKGLRAGECAETTKFEPHSLALLPSEGGGPQTLLAQPARGCILDAARIKYFEESLRLAHCVFKSVATEILNRMTKTYTSSIEEENRCDREEWWKGKEKQETQATSHASASWLAALSLLVRRRRKGKGGQTVLAFALVTAWVASGCSGKTETTDSNCLEKRWHGICDKACEPLENILDQFRDSDKAMVDELAKNNPDGRNDGAIGAIKGREQYYKAVLFNAKVACEDTHFQRYRAKGAFGGYKDLDKESLPVAREACRCAGPADLSAQSGISPRNQQAIQESLKSEKSLASGDERAKSFSVVTDPASTDGTSAPNPSSPANLPGASGGPLTAAATAGGEMPIRSAVTASASTVTGLRAGVAGAAAGQIGMGSQVTAAANPATPAVAAHPPTPATPVSQGILEYGRAPASETVYGARREGGLAASDDPSDYFTRLTDSAEDLFTRVERKYKQKAGGLVGLPSQESAAALPGR